MEEVSLEYLASKKNLIFAIIISIVSTGAVCYYFGMLSERSAWRPTLVDDSGSSYGVRCVDSNNQTYCYFVTLYLANLIVPE